MTNERDGVGERRRLSAGRDAVHRQFAVRFQEGAWPKREEISKKFGVAVEMVFDINDLMVRVYQVPPSESSAAALVAVLDDEKKKAELGLRYVEQNRAVRPLARPDDPLFDEQWAWRRLEAEAAWARTHKAGDVIVAVVDSGIATGHEDLQGELWENLVEKTHGNNQVDDDGNGVIDDIYGARFTVAPPDGSVEDPDGHGTLLAGTIGAIMSNKKGVTGAASPIKLMAVKFFDALSWPTSAAAAQAIVYAVNQNAVIINASWDVGFDSMVLRNAIEKAEAAGVLIVAAAGNSASDNDRSPTYPASYNYSNVISVMATDEVDEWAWFSNYGEKTVHLAAPGVRILSTYPYFLSPPRPRYVAYRFFSGTSAAAAFVSGAAALLKHLNPQWTPLLLREHIMASAEGVQGLRRRCASGGRLSFRRAVVGPLKVLKPGGGDVVPRGTITDVLWLSDYQTKACKTVSIAIRDGGGTWTVLATNVTNDGTFRVTVPNTSMSKAQIRIASEQGDFPADSERFQVA